MMSTTYGNDSFLGTRRHRKLEPLEDDAEFVAGSYIVLFYHPPYIHHHNHNNTSNNTNPVRRRGLFVAGRSLEMLQEEEGIIVQYEYQQVLPDAIAIENVTDAMLGEILEDPNVALVIPVRIFISKVKQKDPTCL
jgi:hypothetical protein